VTGGDSAGHGHYVAERINGLFQVTLDREPDRVGAAHRIEKTHRTDAYNDESRQDRIRKKKEIIAQLRYLSPSDKDCFDKVYACRKAAVYTPTRSGVADAVAKMCLGNGLGFRYDETIALEDIFAPAFGSFIIETEDDIGVTLGYTTDDGCLTMGGEQVEMSKLLALSEAKLEDVYPTRAGKPYEVSNVTYTGGCTLTPAIKAAKPRVLIPVFPGTNCEYDTARAFRDAGAEPEIFVVRNLTASAVSESVEAFAKKLQQANIVFLPGGFSGGDEPDGSGKFITAFFRNGAVADGVRELLQQRDGLMGGICNGFQALIKLGLVPYGDIRDMDAECPTLTFNTIARHQSRIVRVRVASNLSPWLQEAQVGGVYNVPISHGEGRFLASDELVAQLAASGQIATQYADLEGNATDNILFNPNGSVLAVEGITSPDGRVFGKMGHAERYVRGLYNNVPGDYDIGMFRSAVKYFK